MARGSGHGVGAGQTSGRSGEEKGRGDLLLSGVLMRVAEEVERRLLMAASPDCFRFMVDVERLSTRRGREEVERKGREEVEVEEEDRQGRRRRRFLFLN